MNLNFLGSHSLDISEDHSSLLNEISDWHSSTSSFHGANVIPVVKHIGKDHNLYWFLLTYATAFVY